MKQKSLIRLTLLFVSIIFIATACKKDKQEITAEDSTLFSNSTSGTYTFYNNIDTIYDPAGGSPHGNFKLKFNSVANAALDSTGKLPVGSSFPNNSVIVKDVYSSSGNLNLVVVMQKASGNSNAGANWLWGEYKPNGEVVYSVREKGASCTGCHGVSGNRDYTLSFDLH
ncbi:MAG TPA: cytochrome P460 family protein [Bacteroidia bacterium]|nr:cytochrome P460 family protein [Bacteroidia bacterium]